MELLIIRMAKGKFIVFEGLDGAGTTTQCNLLIEYLKEQKHKVFITAEPTENIMGGLIKSRLKRQWKTSPAGLQLLFAADRAHHLSSEIQPMIDKGVIVICDRYRLSSIAFGGIDLDTKWLEQINSLFPKPDLTIFIDADIDVCIERLKRRTLSLELYEEKKKLKAVRKNYLAAIKTSSNVATIDGDKSVADVFTAVKNAVDLVTSNS